MLFNISVSIGQVYDPYPYPCPIPGGGFLYNLSSSQTATESFGKLPTQAKDKALSTRKELRPYIDIDMGKVYKISKIRLTSPTEPRQKTYSIFVSPEKFPDGSKEELRELAADNASIKVIPESRTFSSSDSIAFFPPLEGRYFRIQLNGDEPQSLVLSGLEFFGICGGPPRDPEDSKCDNGGFETNTFSGWTGQTAKWADPPSNTIINVVSGLNPDNHRILSVPFVDELGLPIIMPCKGSYVVKLGNSMTREVERLRYRFTVNQQNADFFFRYAFVQEDGQHTLPDRNPYFQYKVIRLLNNTVQASRLIEFNPSNPDPFFKVQGEYLYRSWTCVNVNLSSFIGEEFAVEFENADCSETGHFGYSYIDGLCTSAADNKPVTTLVGSTKLCGANDFIFSGANSCNANRAIWTITQVDGGAACQKEIFGQPDFINIKNEFNTCGTFDITKRYRISLKVFNDCGEGSTQTIETQGVPSKIAYSDVVVCNQYSGEIKIKASKTCSTCTYSWTRGGYRLQNPNIDEPILKPQQYIPCGQVLEVSATDVDGCVFTQEVKLFTFNGSIVSIDKDVDKTDLNDGSAIPKSVYCGYEVKVNVNIQSCIPQDKIKVIITSDADPNFSKIAEVQSTNSSGQLVFKAIIPQNLGEDLQNTSNKLKATLVFDLATPPNNLTTYGCNFESNFTLENRFWYFGYWKDNVVTAGNYIKHGTITAAIPYKALDGSPLKFPALYGNVAVGVLPPTNNVRIVNSTFTYPTQPNPIKYGYGAFAVNVKIGNRWGDVFFRNYSKTALQPSLADHNRFLEYEWTNIWDGTRDNVRVQQGVYLMVVSVSNCRVTNQELYRTYLTIP